MILCFEHDASSRTLVTILPTQAPNIPVIPDMLNSAPSCTYILQLTGSSKFLDHDGDSRAPPAGLPLHRSEPHCEGADPLNGGPRPDPECCIQLVPH
ncbi:unnamed protein product [Arctia plantaginis]|uniref:Uncharacterized protein n=1 Tax=Arctia plantaginis TaxID=874455 RepID=A0A8S0ZVS4_ARCPL|nr:unnamed protein product [Arctia plantaginis]CAB3238873.1 unnamed protein product [Arctia plantaginis]